MPDVELAAALRLAKTKPMFFAFIPKLPSGKLLVSKTKIPMKDVLEIKKQLSAGTPVTGTCSGPLDDMIFKVGKPVAGAYENVVPQIVKKEAGVTIAITFEFGGKDMEADATELDKEDAKIPPPLPIPQVGVKPGAETSYLYEIADILDSFRPMKGNFPDGQHYNLTIKGRDYEMTQQEVESNRKNAKAAFARAIKQVPERAADAKSDYKDYRKTMKSGWFGTTATWIFEHTSVTDPGDRIDELESSAGALCAAAAGAASGNKFRAAADALIDADTKAHIIHALMLRYKAGLEGSAGSTVTFLEGVKTASEITLEVGGAVVSGGATVAFVGTTAITAAEDLAPALAGNKINWAKFGVDMALAIVTKKLGPSEAVEKAVMEKLGTDAVKKIGVKKAEEAVAKVLGASSEILMKKSVESVQKNLSGQEVTWDDFSNDAKKDYYKQAAVETLKLLVKK